jgi:hypothetical protein
MNKKKTLSIPLYKGMSIYKRHGTQYWWGYLRINGKQYKKSLETTNKQEAEQLVFQWKNDLLSEANLSSTRSFKFWADKFIELQKEKPIPASGQSAYQYAKKALYRTNGLVEFLGHKNVDEITRLDVEEFYNQMPIEVTEGVRTQLSTSYMRKHKILLSQILNLAESKINFKLPNPVGKKSQRRGYFDNEEYVTIRNFARDQVGDFKYVNYNGTTYVLTKDLHNALIFLMSTMLRPTVKELMTLKHKDIKEKKSKGGTNFLQFTVDRKNKTQLVESLESGYFHYAKNMKGNRNDFLFYPEYSNRRHAMSLLSRMFVEVIKHLGLETGKNGEKRTLYSIRHSAIISNLKHTDRTDIEKRADTSPDMISNWYFPESQIDENRDDYLRTKKVT